MELSRKRIAMPRAQMFSLGRKEHCRTLAYVWLEKLYNESPAGGVIYLPVSSAGRRSKTTPEGRVLKSLQKKQIF